MSELNITTDKRKKKCDHPYQYVLPIAGSSRVDYSKGLTHAMHFVNRDNYCQVCEETVAESGWEYDHTTRSRDERVRIELLELEKQLEETPIELELRTKGYTGHRYCHDCDYHSWDYSNIPSYKFVNESVTYNDLDTVKGTCSHPNNTENLRCDDLRKNISGRCGPGTNWYSGNRVRREMYWSVGSIVGFMLAFIIFAILNPQI